MGRAYCKKIYIKRKENKIKGKEVNKQQMTVRLKVKQSGLSEAKQHWRQKGVLL